MIYLSSFRYAALVWLTGLLTVPILYITWGTVNSRNFWGGIYSGIEFCWYQIVLPLAPWTIPSLLLFIWASFTVCKRPGTYWEKRLALLFFGLMLLFLPNALRCFINNSNEFFDSSYLLTLYWIPGFISIFLYRIPIFTTVSDEMKNE